MYTVRRSAWRMWGLSLLGVPMAVVAVDVLTTNRFTNVIREFVFGTGETQVIEPRDQLWAAALGLVGGVLIAWGLWELVRPRAVVSAHADGVSFFLRGPFRPATNLAWDQIEDLGAGVVVDGGTELPVLWLTAAADLLPPNPWGARYVSENKLAILAADWEAGPADVARALVDLALSQPVASPDSPPPGPPAEP